MDYNEIQRAYIQILSIFFAALIYGGLKSLKSHE